MERILILYDKPFNFAKVSFLIKVGFLEGKTITDVLILKNALVGYVVN